MMWKEANGKSKTAATRQELKKMRDNSSKAKTIARLGNEGKAPENPSDEIFVEAFGQTAPT